MTPKHALPISLKGYKPGDFAMIIGFPGRTNRFLTSYGIEQMVNKDYPAWVEASKAVSYTHLDVYKRQVYSHLAYIPGTTQTLISAGQDTATIPNQGSSISTDGGATWTSIVLTGQVLDLTALNSNQIIGGGYSTTAGGTGSAYKLSPLLATVDANLSATQLSVYPNPTNGEVNIVSKSNVKSVQLMDMNGKLIKNFSSAKQLNISSVESGVYLLKVTTEDGKSTATKLIKK